MLQTALVVAVLIGVVGCATVRNYEDPSGPVLAGGVTAAESPPKNDIRIVTFNLKFGEHLDRAADLLSRPGPLMGADIICLQEMDGPGTETLARALGLNFVYVPSAVLPSSRHDFGVSILSRWPLEDGRKVRLPHEHRFKKLRRSAVAVTVLNPVGRLRVYAVHFETAFGAWDSARRDQARAVLADALSWSGPVVIAGDFNGRGPADEIAGAGYLWLTRNVHHTAYFFDFDHILVRDLCEAGDVPAAKAKDETGASDHRPVWTVVRRCDAVHQH